MASTERGDDPRQSPVPSIHDNRVVSYSVFADNRRILLRTVSDDGKERADVEFAGVIAYRFESDNFQTILFDIDEKDAVVIFEENRELFEEGRGFLWPGAWNNSTEEALAHLRKIKARGFEISSSLGMSGWVLAAEMNIRSTR